MVSPGFCEFSGAMVASPGFCEVPEMVVTAPGVTEATGSSVGTSVGSGVVP